MASKLDRNTPQRIPTCNQEIKVAHREEDAANFDQKICPDVTCGRLLGLPTSQRAMRFLIMSGLGYSATRASDNRLFCDSVIQTIFRTPLLTRTQLALIN